MNRMQFVAISLAGAAITLGVGWAASEGSQPIGAFPSIFVLAVIALAIQWIAYVPAALKKTETFYDLVGAGTYLLLVGYAVYRAHDAGILGTRGIVLCALVSAWALRLGSYLGARVHRVGKDGRFDHIKIDPWHFLMVWTLQGLWVLLRG